MKKIIVSPATGRMLADEYGYVAGKDFIVTVEAIGTPKETVAECIAREIAEGSDVDSSSTDCGAEDDLLELTSKQKAGLKKLAGIEDSIEKYVDEFFPQTSFDNDAFVGEALIQRREKLRKTLNQVREEAKAEIVEWLDDFENGSIALASNFEADVLVVKKKDLINHINSK